MENSTVKGFCTRACLAIGENAHVVAVEYARDKGLYLAEHLCAHAVCHVFECRLCMCMDTHTHIARLCVCAHVLWRIPLPVSTADRSSA